MSTQQQSETPPIQHSLGEKNLKFRCKRVYYVINDEFVGQLNERVKRRRESLKEHQRVEQPLRNHEEELVPNNEHDTDIPSQGFSHHVEAVTILVVEGAQPIPQRAKNGRMLSQSENAIWVRNHFELNPRARERQNVQKIEYRYRRRAFERARLEATNFGQPLGELDSVLI